MPTGPHPELHAKSWWRARYSSRCNARSRRALSTTALAAPSARMRNPAELPCGSSTVAVASSRVRGKR